MTFESASKDELIAKLRVIIFHHHHLCLLAEVAADEALGNMEVEISAGSHSGFLKSCKEFEGAMKLHEKAIRILKSFNEMPEIIKEG